MLRITSEAIPPPLSILPLSLPPFYFSRSLLFFHITSIQEVPTWRDHSKCASRAPNRRLFCWEYKPKSPELYDLPVVNGMRVVLAKFCVSPRISFFDRLSSKEPVMA
jgi:hypothetical protein